MDLMYVHGCGEMKMRMLKIAFLGRGGGGGSLVHCLR